jgi:2-isopropylmalate synthase
LKEYHVSAVTAGRDALAEVTVLVDLDGRIAQGKGVSPDTMEASGRAYLRAIATAIAMASTDTAEPVPAS